ncbi:MAG: hypothetical protein QMB16_01630 [Paracoccaceae bacterium]|jgi:hypothetical protein
MFNELIKEITKSVEANENRTRARAGGAQSNFEYVVGFILEELWRNSRSIPPTESLINLRNGYYSELRRYKDATLTYRQVKAAFDGLIRCRMIEVTAGGYFLREKMRGELTRFVSTDRLLERFENLEGHPAILVLPDLDAETIILRDEVDGANIDIDYEDTDKTDRFRSSLKKINQCFLKHWADLRIKDTQVSELAERINQHDNKEPIDFSRRTLARIFANGSFEEGGRFYRGWWQNVPSEYRKYITIDEFITTEYDFSQLSPHVLYFAHSYQMGNEDAYDRVLDGQHRDVVKQAFNAMVQSKTPLNRKPDKINLDGLDMGWQDLRQRILDSHKPIQNLFFTGIGNKLQFKDSCIAESVMLQFAGQNQVALPIHDSFIMRVGHSGELEEAMRRAFYGEFQADIPIKREVIIERIALFDEHEDPRTDAITRDDRKHNQWYDRNTLWLHSRGQ